MQVRMDNSNTIIAEGYSYDELLPPTEGAIRSRLCLKQAGPEVLWTIAIRKDNTYVLYGPATDARTAPRVARHAEQQRDRELKAASIAEQYTASIATAESKPGSRILQQRTKDQVAGTESQVTNTINQQPATLNIEEN